MASEWTMKSVRAVILRFGSSQARTSSYYGWTELQDLKQFHREIQEGATGKGRPTIGGRDRAGEAAPPARAPPPENRGAGDGGAAVEEVAGRRTDLSQIQARGRRHSWSRCCCCCFRFLAASLLNVSERRIDLHHRNSMGLAVPKRVKWAAHCFVDFFPEYCFLRNHETIIMIPEVSLLSPCGCCFHFYHPVAAARNEMGDPWGRRVATERKFLVNVQWKFWEWLHLGLVLKNGLNLASELLPTLLNQWNI